MDIGLDHYSRSSHQLSFRFHAGALSFSTSFWYQGVDLLALEARFGHTAMARIYFHIAACELLALSSLRPTTVDFGPLAEHHTPAFAALWQTLFDRIWAQWRYENRLPRERGPALPAPAASGAGAAGPGQGPIAQVPGPVEALAFCGGGKDSLVCLTLLEDAGIRYDAHVYSHSIYGPQAPQHALIDGLMAHLKPGAVHRGWVQSEFLDAPVLALHPELEISTLCAAETPSSLFAALPVALAHGHRYLVLGHERSADVGQLVWDETGEDVNHQWGKSLAAEALLNGYIRDHLVTGVEYFSLLKPIYDVLICNLLRGRDAAVRHTHSCNLEKPWCKRCPKCAYVWLHYAAWLPQPLVDDIFGADNLLDFDENQLTYRQLLGLEDRLPFECIGQVGEVRLAFQRCYERGRRGRAMDTFLGEVGPLAPETRRALLDQYLAVAPEHAAIPPAIGERVLPLMRAAAREAHARLAEPS